MALDPLPEQEDLFRQFAGVCRLVYNLALEQKALWGRKHCLGYVAQAADLTRLRVEFDLARDVYVSCQQQALRDFDRSFSNFFAGRARFLRLRRRGVDDSFRFPSREVAVKRLRAPNRTALSGVFGVALAWPDCTSESGRAVQHVHNQSGRGPRARPAEPAVISTFHPAKTWSEIVPAFGWAYRLGSPHEMTARGEGPLPVGMAAAPTSFPP